MQIESSGALSGAANNFTEQHDSTLPKEESFWGDDGFSFGDIVDALNPLQHLPVVGTAYRAMTDDDLSSGARMIGGTLFGGPVGFVVSLINSVLDNDTGKDIGEHVLSWFDGDDDPVSPLDATQVAAASNVLPQTEMASAQPEEITQTTLMVRKEQEMLQNWLAARGGNDDPVLPSTYVASAESSEQRIHDQQIMRPLAEFTREYQAKQWAGYSEGVRADLSV